MYINEEHKKGHVSVAVPDDFHDLSLEHHPLGCLCDVIQVSRDQYIYLLVLYDYRIPQSGQNFN